MTIWYAVAAQCRCNIVHEDGAVLTELTVFLMTIANGEVPDEKAQKLAKGREHSYKNSDGDDVFWTLHEVRMVSEVDEPFADDSEIIGLLDWERSAE